MTTGTQDILLNKNARWLMDIAADAMLIADADGRILLANPAAERFFGYTQDEFAHLAIEDLIPQRFRVSHHKKRADYAERPASRSMGGGTQLYGLRKDGGEFAADVGLSPIESGYVLATVYDIGLFSRVKENHLEEPGVKSELVAHASPLSIARAVTISDSIFPGSELRGVETPDGEAGVYVVARRQSGEANRRWPRSKVWIDQYSGKVLFVQDPNRFTAGETFLNWMWPLHSGEAFGFAGRILWCVTGLAPLVLYVTGILRWLQKRRAKRLVNIADGYD